MRKVPAFLEVVAFAMVVALTNAKNMITILMFSFTLRAGGTFFPYVLGHFWKRAGSAGSIASIILGSLTVVLVEPDIVSLFGLQPIVPRFALRFVFIGSFLSPLFKSEGKGALMAYRNDEIERYVLDNIPITAYMGVQLVALDDKEIRWKVSPATKPESP